MFEKIRIKEHMEVADCKGQHVGTVDEVEGDAIKLTKSDSADSMHSSRLAMSRRSTTTAST